MNIEKLDFLLNKFPSLLAEIDPQSPPKWGKMNVHQMIEHMIDSVQEANGKIPRKILTDPERLPAMKAFIMSEKEFRPGTKNALMSEEPLPVRTANLLAAIEELRNELQDFRTYFDNAPENLVTNAFFGDLNYAEWVQLLHKHAIHHLKQFDVLPG